MSQEKEKRMQRLRIQTVQTDFSPTETHRLYIARWAHFFLTNAPAVVDAYLILFVQTLILHRAL